MSDMGWALFETAIGSCGIAWRSTGIAGVQLPEADSDATLARLRRRFPELAPAEPPDWVAQIVAAVRGLLAGEGAALAAVPLDWSGISSFEASVYREALGIPAGQTRTYGAIAEQLGEPGQARAVGQALGRNPWPIIVPCHRIVAAEGRTGGFSAHGGSATKLRLLELEGALKVEALPLFGVEATR